MKITKENIEFCFPYKGNIRCNIGEESLLITQEDLFQLLENCRSIDIEGLFNFSELDITKDSDNLFKVNSIVKKV